MSIDWSASLDLAFENARARAITPESRCPGCPGCPTDVKARETQGLVDTGMGHPGGSAGVPGVPPASLVHLRHLSPVKTAVSERLEAPPDWCAGYRCMVADHSVPGVEPTKWRDLTLGIAMLLQNGWAARAHALGWSCLDLFGCWPTAPIKRIDQQGLVWFLHPDVELLAITDAAATQRTKTGATKRFFRKGHGYEAPAIPIWELVSAVEREGGEDISPDDEG
jgi:hypothetical protein